jgi:dTDP-4-amino-4,6-dideoxygalactose transaminase
LLDEEKNIWFSHGRDALFILAKVLHDKKLSSILVPSFVCDAAVLPLLGSLNVLFYEVDFDLIVRPDEIKKIISEKNINTLMIVNYFGLMQPYLTDIRDLCKRNKVLLIEDSAQSLSFYTKCQDESIKGDSDFELYCPHKQLAIPDGALLVCANEEMAKAIVDLRGEPKKNKAAIRSVLRMFYEGLFGPRNDPPDKIINLKSSTPDAEWGTRPKPFGGKISPVSEFIFKRVDVNHIINKRRSNYNLLVRLLESFKIGNVIQKELSPNEVPFLLPIIIDEKYNIKDDMLNCGIPVYFWPRLSKPVREGDFVKTKKIADRLLVVSIQQDFSNKDIHGISKKMIEISDKYY